VPDNVFLQAQTASTSGLTSGLTDDADFADFADDADFAVAIFEILRF
jgi:hypothetical protein